ncbi:AraC family transcriptional regulator [Niabella beijingensis]|uniref:AraC family transcriptional regulator n=1 Tax=Niabella beijingensis TaxID=2872700 RepID=UPI001CBCBC6D|nr:AraC family transcriptional regulator [Niabella beijingensis]MBZ4189504.1 AraC family transcriptional regulator [Niabella beijingensis]
MKNFHKYLAKTSIEDNWGLYVTTVGYTKIREHQPYPVSREHPTTHRFTWNKGRILNDYYIVFISKGSGVFETAHQQASTIQEGSCFLLFPGTWHRYKPSAKIGWEEYWIGFNGYYPQRLMRSGFFSKKNPVIHVGLNEELLMAFHGLIDTIRNAAPGYHQLIAGIVLQIISLVYNASVYKQENTSDALQYISKAKFLLQEALESDVHMTEVAQQLTVSYSKFRKDFKAATGISPNQYHLELRLGKACELLRATSLPVREIAYQTGFETLFYFSRIFKKKFDLSPMHYRQLHRK